MLHTLKQIVPDSLKQPYHYALARMAEKRYGSPSSEMIVIGVTGTNGKSSTVNFIAQLLTALGEKVGYTSTAGFNVAGQDIPNTLKMTMPGRFLLQKILRDMVTAGCRYAIVETSSQGLAQFRHIGLQYDMAVFLNLTPEHLESHGGFDRYKEAKGLLFRHLSSRPRKVIAGKAIETVAVLNAESEHAAYYASFPADRHVYFGAKDLPGEGLRATMEPLAQGGVTLTIDGQTATLHLGARYQWSNALAAITAVTSLGFPLSQVMQAAMSLREVAGRFERIDCGQPFTVIVDYAYEPYALRALFDAARAIPHERVIGIHGSAGGGRDVARRPLIGRLAAEEEQIVVVTNEDPYDEDPRQIMKAVAEGAKEGGKVAGEDLFLVDDRRAAIAFAFKQAKPQDIVLITGKGSEPVMALAGGKKMPWDDRAVAREELIALGYTERAL